MILDKTVIIDLTGCEHVGKIHPRIKEAFDFPDWYGHNWDAFRDFLFWEYPVTKVIVKGAGTLPSIFKTNLDVFHDILDERKQYCISKGTVFDYEFS